MEQPRNRAVALPPSLAGFLRTTRRRKGLSRLQLARGAAVSSSYIAQLEQGEKTHPSAATMATLADILDLDPAERRHAFNLAHLVPPATTPESVSAYVAQMRRAIGYLPCVAVFTDQLWNIIAVNERAAATFPGIAESRQLLLWIFGNPAAEQVLVEWQAEAEIAVQWWRGFLGVQHDEAVAAELLRELSAFPEFRRIWADQRVRFRRDEPYIHVSDPRSGVRTTLYTWLYGPLPDSHARYLTYVGVPLPSYTGPTAP